MKTALIVAGAILLAGTTGAAAQSALAPDLATNDECMGSSSIGGQNPFIGISIGTTWFDTSCDRLRKAKFLMDADQKKAAIALMCADDEVRRAMDTAGTPCPVRREPLPTAMNSGPYDR